MAAKKREPAEPDQEPRMKASVTDELREEENGGQPQDDEDPKPTQGLKPLIAIMARTRREAS